MEYQNLVKIMNDLILNGEKSVFHKRITDAIEVAKPSSVIVGDTLETWFKFLTIENGLCTSKFVDKIGGDEVSKLDDFGNFVSESLVLVCCMISAVAVTASMIFDYCGIEPSDVASESLMELLERMKDEGKLKRYDFRKSGDALKLQNRLDYFAYYQ